MFWLNLALVLAVGVVGTICALWGIITADNFDRTAKPGEVYRVGDRTYTVPRLPIKVDHRPASTDRPIRILSEDFMLQTRKLLQTGTQLLDARRVPYFISGGTLLGFMRHGTVMPWDDDADVHARWQDREYLFSAEFVDHAAAFGLQVIALPQSSLHHATKEGGAVRLRLPDTDLPVLDIFFEKQIEPQDQAVAPARQWPGDEQKTMWGKVDMWLGDRVWYNAREIWPADALFPLERKTVDGLSLLFPRDPQKLIATQYSPKAMQSMVYTSPLMSHQFPYRFLSAFWRTREGTGQPPAKDRQQVTLAPLDDPELVSN